MFELLTTTSTVHFSKITSTIHGASILVFSSCNTSVVAAGTLLLFAIFLHVGPWEIFHLVLICYIFSFLS